VEWQRPHQTSKSYGKEATHPHYKQINTPRHTITVDFHLFVKELKKTTSESLTSLRNQIFQRSAEEYANYNA